MKILQSEVGAFVANMAAQLKSAAGTMNSNGLFIDAADISIEFSAEVIQDAQSLPQVTTTASTKSGSTSTPAKTRTETPDTTDTTTRTATTGTATSGTNSDDATYSYSDHSD